MTTRDKNRDKNKERDKSLDGYSLGLALLLVGFVSIYFSPFNPISVFNTSKVIGGVLIFIGLAGLSTELSKLVKNEGANTGLSDFGVSIFMIAIFYVSWLLFDYLNWLNNFTLILFLFFAILIAYALVRGIALVVRYLIKNTNKKAMFEVGIRVAPIVISIITILLNL